VLTHLIHPLASNLADDLPISQEHDAIRIGGSSRIVSHHDDGLAELITRPAQEPHGSRPRLGIQVASRLVGQDDGGFGSVLAPKSPGHGPG
jgi:hypothetical protein